MKNSTNYLFVVLMLVCSVGFADRMRNGGDYVICNENRSQTYFYDYYELTKILGQKPLVAGGYSISQWPIATVKEIIERQSDADLVFKNLLLSYLSEMKASIVFKDQEMRPVDDNPEPILKRRCQLYQGAVSGPGLTGHVWGYEIFDQPWHDMSSQNRVALMLHEIIYRVAHSLGKSTSTEVRLINQKMMMTDRSQALRTDIQSLYELRKSLGMLLPTESYLRNNL